MNEYLMIIIHGNKEGSDILESQKKNSALDSISSPQHSLLTLGMLSEGTIAYGESSYPPHN